MHKQKVCVRKTYSTMREELLVKLWWSTSHRIDMGSWMARGVACGLEQERTKKSNRGHVEAAIESDFGVNYSQGFEFRCGTVSIKVPLGIVCRRFWRNTGALMKLTHSWKFNFSVCITENALRGLSESGKRSILEALWMEMCRRVHDEYARSCIRVMMQMMVDICSIVNEGWDI